MGPSYHHVAASLRRSIPATAALHAAARGRPTIVGSTAPQRCFHRTTLLCLPRHRSFFTSNFLMQQDGGGSDPTAASDLSRSDPRPSLPLLPGNSSGSSSSSSSSSKQTGGKTSKRGKTPVGRGKNPLRAVAAKAQRQPTGGGSGGRGGDGRGGGGALARPGDNDGDDDGGASLVSAVCVAEGFAMDEVTAILSAHGFALDPDGTGFEPHEVVHARGQAQGDIFVFPSGTVVTWALPRDVAESLATRTLLPAAEEPHLRSRETEDLEFVKDPDREASAVVDDETVVLGTRRERDGGGDGGCGGEGGGGGGGRLDTTLAQIAFSSGLAQSTKLAVLESSLNGYFESMRRLPENLSRGSDLRLNNRRFILQKTGELLSLRAQLNHYSELTDSLPDIFWESRGSERNLEGYFDQVGKALDVRVRIRTLNEKMDYAQEMASVLREMSAQKHGTRLEWIIIILIAVEVMFELRRVYMEQHDEVPSHRPRPSADSGVDSA
ncbi:hypothetical protein RB596_005006 [Gaeumannomyces avenae]